MKFNLKNYLPYLAAIAVFAILTLVYFKPLLSGKELKQDDISRHKGMSKEIVDYRIKNKAEPLWTNSMFGGMPAYQISTIHSGNWVNKLDATFKLYLPHPGGYLFLYFLGFFILLLCFEVNVWLALVGAIAYGLSSYFLIIIEAGHNSKANALGYLPALIGGVILLFRGKYWLGISITALFTAMELNANHVQISYYGYILIAFIVGGYFFTYLKQKQLKEYFKAVALLIIASVVGALPNAGNLMTTNEYGKFSTRGRSQLTIDYNSVRAARSGAEGLDGNLNSQKDGIVKPGLIDRGNTERVSKNTTSGLDKDYATNWSYGIGETFTFLIPDFKGGASGYIGQNDKNALKKVNPDYREMVAGTNSYYGDQPFTSGPVYIGSIIIFLALLGMFVIKNPVKWPIFFGTLLTIALSWGNNFMPLTDFFMDHVPGYNKFRAVSMLLVIAELTLPLLAILGINEIIKYKNWDEKIKLRLLKKEMSLKKLMIISVSVVGGFCLLGYLAPDMVNTFHASGEEEQLVQAAVRQGQGSEDQIRAGVVEMMPQIELARKAIFKSDAVRSLVFILLSFGVLFMFFTGKIKKELLFGTLGLFILIDMWTVDNRYLNEKSFITKSQNQESISAKTETDEQILKDPALDYRVMNIAGNTFNDAATSYYHKSIGGYHGAKLKKYQELIDFHLDEEISLFRKNAGKAFASDSLLDLLLSKLHVINMLNTKYFIIPAGERGETMPMPNRQANGNAWFIKSLKFVNDADSELVGLYFIDTKNMAIANRNFKDQLNLKPAYTGVGQIKLNSYEPNRLVYESNTSEEQFAVFSEIYYPMGWNAYVDGQLKPHANINYVLRGLNIPAGKHSVEFKFEPAVYKSSNNIAMIGSVLLFGLVGAGIFMGRKKKEIN